MNRFFLFFCVFLRYVFASSLEEPSETCFGSGPIPKREFEKALQAVCGVGAQQSPDTLLLICPFFHDFFQCDHRSFVQKAKELLRTEATLEIDIKPYKFFGESNDIEAPKMVFPEADTIVISTHDDVFVSEQVQMFEVRIEYYF